eukprot:m.419770 g.419770  ORF g.419770 m.419770 type:complete len:92 (+) comp56628_c0_seq1:1433-1708(+)
MRSSAVLVLAVEVGEGEISEEGSPSSRGPPPASIPHPSAHTIYQCAPLITLPEQHQLSVPPLTRAMCAVCTSDNAKQMMLLHERGSNQNSR